MSIRKRKPVDPVASAPTLAPAPTPASAPTLSSAPTPVTAGSLCQPLPARDDDDVEEPEEPEENVSDVEDEDEEEYPPPPRKPTEAPAPVVAAAKPKPPSKRSGKKAVASTGTEVVGGVHSGEAPPAKPKAPARKRNRTTAAKPKAAAAVVATTTADGGDETNIASGDVAAPVAPAPEKKTKKPAVKRAKAALDPVFIEGYGDDEVWWKESARTKKPDAAHVARHVASVTSEAHAMYKAAWQHRLDNETDAQWAKAKTKRFKEIRGLYCRKANQQRPLDKFATAARLQQRLEEMDPAEFGVLDARWLGTFGMEGKMTAAELDAVTAPEVQFASRKDNFVLAYAVYRAALTAGVHPLGLVSEEMTKGVYSTDAEPRQYIGAKFFDKREASKFCMIPADKVLMPKHGETATDAQDGTVAASE